MNYKKDKDLLGMTYMSKYSNVNHEYDIPPDQPLYDLELVDKFVLFLQGMGYQKESILNDLRDYLDEQEGLQRDKETE